jgi:DNA adenine methylase
VDADLRRHDVRREGVNCATKKLRPPLKWHGGKSYLARRIVELMPEHETYVEPFVGGGSVLLNKPKANREVASDIDAGLINFWKYLNCPQSPLIGMLRPVDFTEDRCDAACEGSLRDSGAYGAICFIVRNRFSRGGLGKTFAWSERLRGGRPGDMNAWETIKAELPLIAGRMRDVEFHCRTAVDVIRQLDRPGTLFYLDPPYLHETRTAKKAYAHEMSRQDHFVLLEQLQTIQGVAMLSGYRSELYDDSLADWRRVDFDMPNHSGQGATKQRRTECLWINRPQ